ncbi:bifunctional epoxide hydrolase 2-like isoform X2 [Acanthaster planci]|uniref:Bifunctional epoxide hydrolase 2-like isoform X2 n=1 Tax=Acanthaster planci TaxID=133434 RepID=A0A8B7ZE30_ACAPL|nr:bifunctional epoxide hydrolase 2-like isoform X2 [Acanthaster planci]
MAIKAAIFDVGGVLFKSPINFLTQLAEKHGLPPTFAVNVLRKGAPDNAFCRAEKGDLSLSQLVTELQNDFELSAQESNVELPQTFSIKEMVLGLLKQQPHREMINAVINLKNHGLKTCILTNNFIYDLPSEAEEDNPNFFVISGLMFDEVIESCRIGLRKPDLEIYSMACKRLGVSPQETIFIDDLKGNLKNAQKLGINTILFKDSKSALAKIQELTGIDVFQPAVPISADPDKLTHSYVTTTDGVKLHYVEMGEGPAVILCHGFPESWYSWRKQIPALVLAGYRVIVPDQRGFGLSSAPQDIKGYTQECLSADLIALLDSLSIRRAVFVGHDWGGAVVWKIALRYPERTRGVVGVNTAYFPPNPKSNPLQRMYQKPGVFDYQLYFQTPGVAEAELEKDLEKTFKFFFRAPGKQDHYPGSEKIGVHNVRERGGMLVGVPDNLPRPSLLTEKDLAYYVKQYKTSGFRGPLNWYRNVEENWKDSLKDVGRKIHAPALMVTAEKDRVLTPASSKYMEPWVPNLSRLHLENCGHWTQMERAREFNEGLIKWLNDIHKKAKIHVESRL